MIKTEYQQKFNNDESNKKLYQKKEEKKKKKRNPNIIDNRVKTMIIHDNDNDSFNVLKYIFCSQMM